MIETILLGIILVSLIWAVWRNSEDIERLERAFHCHGDMIKAADDFALKNSGNIMKTLEVLCEILKPKHEYGRVTEEDVDEIAKGLRKAWEINSGVSIPSSWNDVSECFKEGYRQQARWLLENYILLKKPKGE